MATTSTGVGRDVSTLGGEISADLRIISGPVALLDALMRRFSTAHNSRSVDRDYGCALSQWLNDNDVEPAAIRARIEAECLKDERVSRARAYVTINEDAGRIDVDIRIDSTFGTFGFTIGIDDVTTQLLTQTIDTGLGL